MCSRSRLMFMYHTVLSRWTIIRKRDTRPPTSPYLRAHEESEAPTWPPPEKHRKVSQYLTIFMWVKHGLELRHQKFHRVYLAQQKHITEFEPLQDFAATISKIYVIAHINLVDQKFFLPRTTRQLCLQYSNFTAVIISIRIHPDFMS